MMYAGIRRSNLKDVKKPYGFGLDLAAVRKRGTFGDFLFITRTIHPLSGHYIMTCTVIGMQNSMLGNI